MSCTERTLLCLARSTLPVPPPAEMAALTGTVLHHHGGVTQTRHQLAQQQRQQAAAASGWGAAPPPRPPYRPAAAAPEPTITTTTRSSLGGCRPGSRCPHEPRVFALLVSAAGCCSRDVHVTPDARGYVCSCAAASLASLAFYSPSMHRALRRPGIAPLQGWARRARGRRLSLGMTTKRRCWVSVPCLAYNCGVVPTAHAACRRRPARKAARTRCALLIAFGRHSTAYSCAALHCQLLLPLHLALALHSSCPNLVRTLRWKPSACIPCSALRVMS